MKKMILKNLGKTDCHILLYNGVRVLINRGCSYELADPYDKKYEEFFVQFRPLGIYLYTEDVCDCGNNCACKDADAALTAALGASEPLEPPKDEAQAFVEKLAQDIDASNEVSAESLKKKSKAELKEKLTKKGVAFNETASKDELIALFLN